MDETGRESHSPGRSTRQPKGAGRQAACWNAGMSLESQSAPELPRLWALGQRYGGRREKGLKTVGITEGLRLELRWLAPPSASPTPHTSQAAWH